MSTYRDLAPEIFRQRLVIEGSSGFQITDEHIKEYLPKLSDVLGMVALTDAVTHRSPKFGWAGWMHWETSGVHVYAWDQEQFFSVDAYTCKPFEVLPAVEFTQQFFQTSEITYKEF